jgi:hypothetical protein
MCNDAAATTKARVIVKEVVNDWKASRGSGAIEATGTPTSYQDLTVALISPTTSQAASALMRSDAAPSVERSISFS